MAGVANANTVTAAAAVLHREDHLPYESFFDNQTPCYRHRQHQYPFKSLLLSLLSYNGCISINMVYAINF